MATWPSIAEPMFPIKETTELPTAKSSKEGPYVQYRKKWTKSKKHFQLEWDEMVSLLEADYQILEQFFYENQGVSFTWTHPVTSIVYTVVFDQDSLDSTIVFPGFRALSIKIREL